MCCSRCINKTVYKSATELHTSVFVNIIFFTQLQDWSLNIRKVLGKVVLKRSFCLLLFSWIKVQLLASTGSLFIMMLHSWSSTANKTFGDFHFHSTHNSCSQSQQHHLGNTIHMQYSCNKQKSRDQRSTSLTSITFYSPSRSPFYSECPKHACNPLPLGIFELLNATSFPQFVIHLLLCLEFVYLAKGAKKRDNEYGIFTISSSTPPMVKGLLFPLSLALLFMYFDELLCL